MTNSKTKTNGAREICREGNGQYGHGLDAVCVCGLTKGRHTAVRPWSQHDLTAWGDDYTGPTCEGFKKARKVG